MMIIPCNHTVPPEKQDIDLINKLEAEKDSIFSLAMEALSRFIQNDKRFTECKACDAVINEYRSKSDTLFAYCTEFYDFTFNKQDRVKRTDFDSEYSTWCQSSDRICVKKRNMVEKMAKLGIRAVKSCGFFYYVGLKRKTFNAVGQKQEK